MRLVQMIKNVFFFWNMFAVEEVFDQGKVFGFDCVCEHVDLEGDGNGGE